MAADRLLEQGTIREAPLGEDRAEGPAVGESHGHRPLQVALADQATAGEDVAQVLPGHVAAPLDDATLPQDEPAVPLPVGDAHVHRAVARVRGPQAQEERSRPRASGGGIAWRRRVTHGGFGRAGGPFPLPRYHSTGAPVSRHIAPLAP